MKKEKYALLDADFISKTHLIRKDEQNKMIDRIMEMQGYRFYCHEQIKIELTRHNIGAHLNGCEAYKRGYFEENFIHLQALDYLTISKESFFAGTEGRLR